MYCFMYLFNPRLIIDIMDSTDYIFLSIKGGATVFPFAGVSVFSEKGDGIYWHNLLKSGDPDLMSTHKACGVIIGGKTIGNKWIGYNNQWNTMPCSLSRSSIFNHYSE